MPIRRTPGHGPQHILTKKVAGKTVAVHLKPGPGLEKVTGEVANYKRFKQIVGDIVEVNDAICAARPVARLADDTAVVKTLQACYGAKSPKAVARITGDVDVPLTFYSYE